MTATDAQRYEPPPYLAERILLRVEVGSTAHGTGLPDQEDYDEMAIMLEPVASITGIGHEPKTITWRPGRVEGERSQPGDYDLVVHPARKWARLAAKGNPSILMLLFGPVRYIDHDLGVRLRNMHSAFWCENARRQFLGYAIAQRERLLGVRGGRHTNRPELVEVHGHDTKYAMHMLRLGFQGIEYMETGALETPTPEREFLSDVRRGKYPLDQVLRIAEENERRLEAMAGKAPDDPDYDTINAWLHDCMLESARRERPN